MKQSLQISGFTFSRNLKYATKSNDIELQLSADGTNWASPGNLHIKRYCRATTYLF